MPVYDAIEPVADEDVEKTLPHLSPMIQDMVKVQRLISGRPQDNFLILCLATNWSFLKTSDIRGICGRLAILAPKKRPIYARLRYSCFLQTFLFSSFGI